MKKKCTDHYCAFQGQSSMRNGYVKLGKKMFLTAIMFLFTLLSFAQDKIVVSGKVSDAKGLPIPGVTVRVQGTKGGTTTDFDGKYSLNDVDSNATLEFTYLGMETVLARVSNRKVINEILKESAANLNEVVVVGFGTQKKANLTGSVTQVKMSEVLGDRPITTIGAALQGAVPGLTVNNPSTPGTPATFNIRGTTSINGGGAYVLIDNAEGDINMLNPQDVESVSVLKDAASTAIYGAKAAFGVVLITTKKAKKNTKTVFNYNNNYAYSKPVTPIEQASIYEQVKAMGDRNNNPPGTVTDYMKYIKEYESNYDNFLTNNPGTFLGGDQSRGIFLPEKDPQAYYYLKDNDIQNTIFDDHGLQKTHNFSVSGGESKVTYRMSLGTVYNDGPLVTNKDRFERLNIGSYVSADLAKWLNTSLDLKYNTSEKSLVPYGNIYLQLADFTPTGVIPKPTDVNGPVYPTSAQGNYILYGNPETTIVKDTRIFSRTVMTPIKGFEGVLEYTMDNSYSDYKLFTKNTDYFVQGSTIAPSSATPRYTNNKSNYEYSALNAYASYSFTSPSGDHRFKILQGFSQQSEYREALNVNRQDIINDDFPSISTATGIINADDSFVDVTSRSSFYRLEYNYKDKYLFETNGRYDGSSKFPKETRFGFFPSVSAGWQVANENFMDWSNDWLNEFKFRSSWGRIGNQNIGAYQYSPKMDSSLAPWINNGIQPPTLAVPPLVRQNFTWESVESAEVGVDLSLFNRRLNASGAYYIRTTKGMLAPGMELPAVVGAAAPLQNTADLENKGWEADFSWRDRIGKVGYHVGFNIYDSQAVITKYNNASALLTINAAGNNTSYYVGQKLGEIWGYRNDGYYTVADFVDTTNWKLKDGVTSIKGVAPRPGDAKFKNLVDNGTSVANQIDGGVSTVADPGDREVIGDSSNHYSYGINGGVSYAGFDFSFVLNGVGKRDVWVSDALRFPFPGTSNLVLYSHQVDYWQPIDVPNGNYEPINPNAAFPRIYDANNNAGSNYRIQDKYLMNGAYLRLKNVTLSYNLPSQIVKKVGFSSIKLFSSLENPYTWSHLEKGRDPETLAWGYPVYSTTSFGLNMTF